MTYVEAEGVYINIIQIATTEAAQKIVIETWLDTDNLVYVREHAVSLQDSILEIYDPQQQHETPRSEVQTTLLTQQGPVVLTIEVIRRPQATSGDAAHWRRIGMIGGAAFIALLAGTVVVAVTLCKQAKRHALQQHVAHVHGYLPVGT